MKSFRIKDPIFKTEPLFVYGCTHKQACAWLRKTYRVSLDDDTDNPITSGRMFTFDKSPWRVVFVDKLSRKPEHLGVLMHELFHLVMRICHDKGVPVVRNHPNGDSGDETAAYLFEFFATQALKKL